MHDVEALIPDPLEITAAFRVEKFKRNAIASIGGTVLLGGIALLALPAQSFIVIPTGLILLGSQLVWIRHWLNQTRAEQPAWLQRH